jgi:hypothetical protein
MSAPTAQRSPSTAPPSATTCATPRRPGAPRAAARRARQPRSRAPRRMSAWAASCWGRSMRLRRAWDYAASSPLRARSRAGRPAPAPVSSQVRASPLPQHTHSVRRACCRLLKKGPGPQSAAARLSLPPRRRPQSPIPCVPRPPTPSGGPPEGVGLIAHDMATLAAVADALKLPGNPNLRHELIQVRGRVTPPWLPARCAATKPHTGAKRRAYV